MSRGTRGAYRKEDRVQLPPELQKELVEKAAARCGNCQELAKHLDVPKSSVHYYMVGRLTIPRSILDRMTEIAADESLSSRIKENGETKDRMWAIWNAKEIFIESCKQRVTLPTQDELMADEGLRRKAASIVSYVQAEGSVWVMKDKWGEQAVNITFADHEEDLYEHFRSLCRDVFSYDIGPSQRPGNGARAIRGFIYSRYVSEWIVKQGVPPGNKAAHAMHFPRWVLESEDSKTWTAALQPWCDGEGCATRLSPSHRPNFTVSQARHTDLDVGTMALTPTKGNPRRVTLDDLRRTHLFGMSVHDYCARFHRSEILDDACLLFSRLGLAPVSEISCLALKDDGFWSCVWRLRFRVVDADRLVRMGLVIQKKKRMILSGYI